MLQNLHTHTNLCDGKNTPEEMVISAIGKGFDSLGFSGHAKNELDFEFCMKDMAAYIAEVNRLKEKYKDKIKIYLGIEEDRVGFVDRDKFDYIIGSMHSFISSDGKYYSIDKNRDSFYECLALFGGDAIALAENYYREFCDYILKRKPDIVGHFDLITKFDEMGDALFSENEKYFEIAEKYLIKAIGSGSFFEVNTGAMSRGYRKTPYPHQRLLRVMKNEGAKMVLTSDCHAAESIDCAFELTKSILKDVGFTHTYVLTDQGWEKETIV